MTIRIMWHYRTVLRGPSSYEIVSQTEFLLLINKAGLPPSTRPPRESPVSQRRKLSVNTVMKSSGLIYALKRAP